MSLKKNKPNPVIKIENQKIGLDYPTYFIADIAANHDGKLDKAIKLIDLAKEAGADAVKFQHFQAAKIVSQYGFESMGKQVSHQSKWKKSVFQVYQDASVPWEWTEKLKNHSDQVGIHFFTAPYDLEVIDKLDPFVPAYKVGSGDVDWLESLEKMAKKKKPIFLSTGAATLADVKQAVGFISRFRVPLCVMQCNTNYTGSAENFSHIHLNVLKEYAKLFPHVVLGLSDHTAQHATVLGAVALGARAIEKHFTDNRGNEGPDHPFSMDPHDWREMVDRTRELEKALGETHKRVADNEKETAVIQRRCIRAATPISKGTVLKRSHLDVLRPAEPGAFVPPQIKMVIGKRLKKNLVTGEAITPKHV